MQADGTVRLSGFRHCLNMTLHGLRRKAVHDFPDFYVHSLNWASRELLEQVRSSVDMLVLDRTVVEGNAVGSVRLFIYFSHLFHLLFCLSPSLVF